MQAIITTGGKQYKVSEGDTLFIEKVDKEAGESFQITTVNAILGDDTATFGFPYVENASVTATVEKNGKGKKIRVFKYNAKKNYRRRQGHRQPYTKVKIGAIQA